MKPIHEEFRDIEDRSIVLFIPPITEYHQDIIDILDLLVNEQNLNCVYVTINKSYRRLNELFSKKGINTEGIFFVDTISKGLGFDTDEGDSFLLADPRNLSGLGIAISNAIKRSNARVMVFDSLSGLNLYNSVSHISKFFHALTAEIRSWNIGAVIISIDGEFKEELIDTFSGFCDKTIRRV
ncbi:MAG: hypothetical protein DRO62_03105 [Candidatus Altiarchaeales archaeon]|nr:MAG: hypothetical protein DRO62_03105 [Candidatus Altiarchaeales archaeon]